MCELAGAAEHLAECSPELLPGGSCSVAQQLASAETPWQVLQVAQQSSHLLPSSVGAHICCRHLFVLLGCHRTVTDVQISMLGLAIAVVAVLSSALQQIMCGAMQRRHLVSSHQLLSNTAHMQARAQLLAAAGEQDLLARHLRLRAACSSWRRFCAPRLACLLVDLHRKSFTDRCAFPPCRVSCCWPSGL